MRVFLCILFIFIASLANAQKAENYVEVTVEDSIQIEAEEILFYVYIGTTYNVDTTGSDYKPEKNKADIEKLSDIVRSMQLDTLPRTYYSIAQRNFYMPTVPVYAILFTSKKQLASFVSKAREIENVYGHVLSMKSKAEQSAIQTLTKKLLKDAQAKAKFIAEQSGKKILTLSSVKDDVNTGGWTSYAPSTMVGESFDGYFEDRKIILWRRLVVRYAWQ